jgi:hypothetical protein
VEDTNKPVIVELGIEFFIEFLIFLYPYGADQMGLPHNFWLGLGCWAVGTIVAIRIFFIFPLWSDRLSRLEKSLFAFIFVAILFILFYRPVVAAYHKQEPQIAKPTEQPSSPQEKPQDKPATSPPAPPKRQHTVPPEMSPTQLRELTGKADYVSRDMDGVLKDWASTWPGMLGTPQQVEKLRKERQDNFHKSLRPRLQQAQLLFAQMVTQHPPISPAEGQMNKNCADLMEKSLNGGYDYSDDEGRIMQQCLKSLSQIIKDELDGKTP